MWSKDIMHSPCRWISSWKPFFSFGWGILGTLFVCLLSCFCVRKLFLFLFVLYHFYLYVCLSVCVWVSMRTRRVCHLPWGCKAVESCLTGGSWAVITFKSNAPSLLPHISPVPTRGLSVTVTLIQLHENKPANLQMSLSWQWVIYFFSDIASASRHTIMWDMSIFHPFYVVIVALAEIIGADHIDGRLRSSNEPSNQPEMAGITKSLHCKYRGGLS